MRSKLMVMSLGSLLAVVTAVSGVTWALFTAQADSSANSFTAGTVEITVANPGTWSAFYNDMAPGDTVSKVVTVKNTGSLKLEFVTVPQNKTGALFSGPSKATVAVSNGTGVLAPGATQDVSVSVSLPLGADNAYQHVGGSLDLAFVAFQTANVTTQAATVTPMGTSGTWDIYRFYDSASNLIILNDTHIISFTEHRPDGSTLSFEIDNSTDPNFYFNNTKPSGTYTYEVMGLNGIKYTATIVRP